MLRNAAMARNEMGLRLASQGNVEAAVAQFEEAVRLGPELEAARANLAAVERQRDNQR
jgi:Tfp pilus assembly protein PilF